MATVAGSTPASITIFLFIISFLLMIVISLVGFIGVGMGRKFELGQKRTDIKFETVFRELKEYRTEKVCKILMDVEEKARVKNEQDINNVGGKVGKLEKPSGTS